MALKITAITRSRPSPCDHWDITVSNEVLGTTYQITGVLRADLNSKDFYSEVPWWVGLAILWLRARIVSGFTFASSINLEIIG
jgi:hypothetical protein